jgi:hypothetical protein
VRVFSYQEDKCKSVEVQGYLKFHQKNTFNIFYQTPLRF